MSDTRTTQGLDQSALRRLNTGVVLRVVADKKEATGFAALAEETGLSRRTVELILEELVAEGWVAETSSARGGGAGRPARRFRFVADHQAIAALFIDTASTTAVVADIRGRVLGRARMQLRDYFDPEMSVDDAAAMVRQAAAQAEIPLERVRGGGIAAGGVIDEHGVVTHLVHAPRWTGFDLPGAMRRRIEMPWIADNGANLAALAERWHGVAIGYRNIAWLILGNRSGAGFILEDALHHGLGGSSGELLESRVLNLEADQEDPIGMLTSPIAAERAGAMRLVRAALDGDRDAILLAENFADSIMRVIDVVTWTVAPELVVLGGGLEDGAELLLPILRERLRADGFTDVALAATSLGQDASLLGAVRAALDDIDHLLFGPSIRS